jgi:hypothetical protein
MERPLLHATVIATLLLVGPAHAQLAGQLRENFMQGAISSCFEKQRGSQENRGHSDAVLKQYCRCNATYMAERMTNDQVMRIEAGQAQAPENLIQESTRFCRQNYSKY